MKEEHGGNPSTGQTTNSRRVAGGISDLDICTRLIEANSATNCAPNEEISPSKPIDKKKEPDQGYYHFDQFQHVGR